MVDKVISQQTPPAPDSDLSDPSHSLPRPILIVEDNDVNATVLSHFLAAYGYPIHRVENGQLAVDFVLNQEVQLIMMDLNMPVMDGYEATRQIRANTQIKQPPIVAVTADTTESSRTKCTCSGIDGFLEKPFNFRQLKDTVSPYLPEISQS